jgi:hypothetical protein
MLAPQTIAILLRYNDILQIVQKEAPRASGVLLNKHVSMIAHYGPVA